MALSIHLGPFTFQLPKKHLCNLNWQVTPRLVLMHLFLLCFFYMNRDFTSNTLSNLFPSLQWLQSAMHTLQPPKWGSLSSLRTSPKHLRDKRASQQQEVLPPFLSFRGCIKMLRVLCFSAELMVSLVVVHIDYLIGCEVLWWVQEKAYTGDPRVWSWGKGKGITQFLVIIGLMANFVTHSVDEGWVFTKDRSGQVIFCQLMAIFSSLHSQTW